ncbi:hypothetical protein DAPPUDRAFT_325742 [Daphnia pulex]|uniref:Uncharacterized protein n=1 Tax=Daphnia pulex TaxID=6669 RepID=E9H5F2_DAPPU|nr:hypothetical protein DAPPUDRAFT_325742 [Daphnia pulex]|eukprot:EFX73015.1 hypothetical protein DAPPUDRAFT_325742 [Daphnia pulex]
MDEVAEIARKVLLPPVKVINDRSYFEKRFQREWSTKVDDAVCDLKKLILNCTFITEEEWTKNSQDVLSLLILCGEHSICSEWSTQKSVDNVKDLLNLLLSKLHLQNIQDIFAMEGVAYSTLQQLKPKLGKNQIKEYPAAVSCFVWIISNTMLPSIDESVDFAVPVSLVLFDDWEPDYQKKGLECLHHILNLNPKSLLQRGWFAVIFSALKKNVEFNDKFNLYKCLDICLKAQNLDPDDPSQWNQDDQYDSLASDVLKSMIIQDSPSATSCNLKILILIFHSMKIKMAKFLPSIISVLDNYVTVGVSPEIHVLSAEVMEQIVEYCWVCLEPQFTRQLSWILFKLVKENVIDEVTKLKIVELQELLKQLKIVL